MLGEDSTADGPTLVLPSAVAALPGGYVVADALQKAVIRLDTAGRAAGRVGRRGEGPGEFRGLSEVFGFGDTIVVNDWALARLTLFTDDSAVRVLSLPKDWAGAEMVGRLPDGRYVLRSSGYSRDPQHGIARVTVTVALLQPGASEIHLDTVTAFPGEQLVTVPHGRSGTMTMNAPHGTRAYVVVWNGQVVIGTSDRYELRVVNTDGSTTSIIRVAGVQQPLTKSVRREAAKRFLEAARQRSNSPIGDQTQAARQILEAMEWPAVLPAFSDVRGTADGNLWVRRTVLDMNADVPWDVFGPNGDWLGTVTVPAGSTLMHIGAPWVILRRYDEDDVPHLTRHEIQSAGCNRDG